MLGAVESPDDDKVKEIARHFNSSFDAFKADKEVVKLMTLKERGQNEGIVIGEARGAHAATEELLKLIKQGYTPDEAADIIKGRYVLPKEA